MYTGNTLLYAVLFSKKSLKLQKKSKRAHYYEYYIYKIQIIELVHMQYTHNRIALNYWLGL